MARERSIKLDRGPTAVTPDDGLLVHIFTDVSTDLIQVRIRTNDHAFTTQPVNERLGSKQAAVEYARGVIQEFGLQGDVRWKFDESPVTDDVSKYIR